MTMIVANAKCEHRRVLHRAYDLRADELRTDHPAVMSTPGFAQIAAAVVLLAVGSMLAGCGGSEESVPPKEARLAVTSFLRATQEGRYSVACVLVTPEARADLRLTVLGSFRATASTTAARLRQVVEAHDRVRTCPATLALLVSELGSKMADLVHGVAAAQVAFLDPGRRYVALDDQAWVVTKGDAGWQIASSNAIGDALP